VAAARPDAAPPAIEIEPSRAAPPDAAAAAPVAPVAVRSAPAAAASAAPGPASAAAAAVAAPEPASAAPAEGRLVITTRPPGAEVFLDGAEKGRTPVELPASGDQHKLALFLAGHKLVRRDIQGRGAIAVDLEPADRLRGPAGIKVRCGTRRRVHITLDDKDTGLMCPTERLAVGLGEHMVVTYDPTSEQTARHAVMVRETHFSVKVTVP
jgi:hypothetical protein